MTELRVSAGVREAVDRHRARMEAVSRAIHASPELRFTEFFAADQLTEWLGEAGFVVKRGAAGLETAFVARHDGSTDGPTIAVLMEFDALPGIGHACGHNLIAAGGALAAVAAIEALPDHPGTVLAIGTPGEEGGGGKIIMLDAGVFDEVDAAVMFHPGDRGLVGRHGLAAAHLGFRFHGKAAHAAKNPEEGRSALAAVQLFLMAVDMMRQFVPSTARMHAVITDGGAAPNVVPATAEAVMFVRDRTADGVADLVARVTDAANGAALATGCSVEVYETAPMYEDRINNMTMGNRCAAYLAELGIGLAQPSRDDPAGSSDIGNVSKALPVIHPYLPIAEPGTPSHSEQFAEAAGSAIAVERTGAMSAALAQTVLDLVSDADFYADAVREYRGSAG